MYCVQPLGGRKHRWHLSSGGQLQAGHRSSPTWAGHQQFRLRTEDSLTPPSLPNPSCLGGNWQRDPEAAVSPVHRTEAEAGRARGAERCMWWAGAECGGISVGWQLGEGR